MQQFAHSWKERRLLGFAVDRVTDLEQFEASQKPGTDSQDKLDAIRKGQKESTRKVDDHFEQTVGNMTKAGWIRAGKKLDELDVTKVKKAVKTEGEKQAAARAEAAKVAITTTQNKAVNKIHKNATASERKLGLASARVEVYREMIADTEQVINHYETDAEGMNELAELLGRDGVNSVELQKKAMLKGVAEDLLAEATDAYDQLKDKEFGADAVDQVDKIVANLEKETLKRDPSALYHLEDALFNAAAYGPKEGAKMVDKMPISAGEKDMLKGAIDKFSSTELKKAAEYHLNTKLKERVVQSTEANTKATTLERASVLPRMKKGQKVQVSISGTRRTFVVSVPDKDSRFTYLIDANGRHASVDRVEDGGNLHLTYFKSGKDKKPQSVVMPPVAPKVLKNVDPTVVYFNAGPLAP